MNLDGYCFTNKGGRDLNEDAADFCKAGGDGIFVVADGLGGHLHGEVASAAVLRTILQKWQNDGPQEDRKTWLGEAIAEANEAVVGEQAQRGGRMKSTVAAVAIDGDHAAWGNVGDSRVYYLRGSALVGVTADHSVAYKKYIHGEISRTDIPFDEDQTSLLRVLGGRDRNEPDLYETVVPLSIGDGFCLCSDGAWEYLYDDEILIDFLKTGSAQEWAELLLLRIMDRLSGGNDNLSVLTVRAAV
ncbi:MAG: serine/threonine-protein phosphatase [Lachnospiraceae bacterium]|nr:serine/threonine-protein phosphatase [Lachnospiraceae bacterium]